MAVIEPKTVTLKNGLEVCIRTPDENDVVGVLEYTRAIFADDRFFLTTAEEAETCWTLETTRERFVATAGNENSISIISVARDKVVSLSNVKGWPKKRMQHIGDLGISILPAFRGIGLGTAVMQVMMDWATAHPVIEKLTLDVMAANGPAIGLYEKMGFAQEGRRIGELKYADGSYSDSISMYRWVK